MKAPNGVQTNLTEEQWLTVRTPAFKAWFGDWEQVATQRALAESTPLKISGELSSLGLDDLRKAAREFYQSKFQEGGCLVNMMT